jgi:hypothetical protein
MLRKTMRFSLAIAAVALIAGAPNAARADINVLWYTGGVNGVSDFSSYNAGVTALATDAATDPLGPKVPWHVTFWAGGAMPAGTFNALVVASPQGGWGTYPSYAALGAAAPTTTLGDRIMQTGQDADWHYMNYPGPTSFNGPKGFLIDAIDWAGSGKGLGAVFLGNSMGAYGFSAGGYSVPGGATNSVTIADASFPINTNLTSAGLSGWNTSSHVNFGITDSSKWTGINVNGFDPSLYVTIVSAGTGGGGIEGPTVPEPSSATIVLLSGSIGLLVAWRRAKARVA